MKFERSSCPITNVLDRLGDKWTLRVIRDLVLGKRRYQEFMASPEAMASHIVADRLSTLQAAGLLERRAYQRNPNRYEYFGIALRAFDILYEYDSDSPIGARRSHDVPW